MYKNVIKLSKMAQKCYIMYLYFISDNILFWNIRNNDFALPVSPLSLNLIQYSSNAACDQKLTRYKLTNFDWTACKHEKSGLILKLATQKSLRLTG